MKLTYAHTLFVAFFLLNCLFCVVMERVYRIINNTFVSLILLAFLVMQVLGLEAKSRLICLLFSLLVFIIRAYWSNSRHLSLIVFLLPILPFWGVNVFNITLLSYLISEHFLVKQKNEVRVERYLILSILVFLSFRFLVFLNFFKRNFDYYLFLDVFQNFKTSGLFWYYFYENKTLLNQLNSLIPYFISYFFFLSLRRGILKKQEIEEKIFLGLSYAILCAASICLLQFFYPDSIFALNRGDFWRMINRYPSTFSDPNSFGVFFGLAFIFISKIPTTKSILKKITLIVILLTFSFAGSRTSFLIFSLYFLPYFFVRFKTKFVIPFLIVLLLFFVPYSNDKIQEFAPNEGFSRIISSLNIKNLGATFFSRRVYSKLALEAFSQEPLIGFGQGGFYANQSRIAADLKIDLNGWKDNANNYYLQIASEEGLIGLCAFIFSLYLLYYSGIFKTKYKSLILIFLISLLTGPHINFDEIKFLIVLVLFLATIDLESLQSRPALKPANSKKVLIWITYFALCSFYLFFLLKEERPKTGFWRRETGNSNVSWFASRASLYLCKPSENQILFQSFAPIFPYDLHVRVYDKNGDLLLKNSFTIKDSSIYPVFIPELDFLEIEIESSKTFIPSRKLGYGDNRILGAMLFEPKGLCFASEL